MNRLFLWLMRALACVPLPALRALGAAIGLLMYALAGRRRRVALPFIVERLPQRGSQ